MKLISSSQILELSVLSLLQEEDLYGYMLTQRVQATIEISESTLYPILRKLEKSGMVKTYNQEYQGRNRKYYSITSDGENYLNELKNNWLEFSMGLNKIIGGQQ